MAGGEQRSWETREEVMRMPGGWPRGSFEDACPEAPMTTLQQRKDLSPPSTPAVTQLAGELVHSGPCKQPWKFQPGPSETVTKTSVGLLLPRSSWQREAPGEKWAVPSCDQPAQVAHLPGRQVAHALWPGCRIRDRSGGDAKDSNWSGIRLLRHETCTFLIFKMPHSLYCIWSP